MRIIALLVVSAVLLTNCNKKTDTQPGTGGSTTTPPPPPHTYIITSYGAVTSLADNTTAVQATIDACAAAGGGTVIVPSGTFLCGPVTLKSNINLRLDSGAVLEALPYGTYPGSGTSSVPHFIYCYSISHFSITGRGTIEGQGSAWWTAFKSNSAIARPAMIRMEKSSYATVTGITVQNAPNGHIVIDKGCDSVTITGVTINSPSSSPNTDGIDTWSTHIAISNCNISDGDDNIAMDSYSAYVNVKNCHFGTGHGCSIGSYTTGVHDITVDSCTFNGTTTGVRMKSSRDRSGLVQNIVYSNLTMTNVTNAVSVLSYYPKTPSSPTADSAQPITATTPDYTNITLKNITATGSANAGMLWGLPELSIGNITFDNVNINAKTGMVINYASGAVFKNGSQIKVSSGNAITAYSATISGINLVTGDPQ